MLPVSRESGVRTERTTCMRDGQLPASHPTSFLSSETCRPDGLGVLFSRLTRATSIRLDAGKTAHVCRACSLPLFRPSAMSFICSLTSSWLRARIQTFSAQTSIMPRIISALVRDVRGGAPGDRVLTRPGVVLVVGWTGLFLARKTFFFVFVCREFHCPATRQHYVLPGTAMYCKSNTKSGKMVKYSFFFCHRFVTDLQ